MCELIQIYMYVILVDDDDIRNLKFKTVTIGME